MAKEINIFLSYANPDQKKVLEVYNFLISNGYKNTWIDCEKLLPGQNWDFEIKKNLKKADIIIIFISKLSIQRRGYVQKEIKLTLNYLENKLIDDIYIIPIKLDNEVNTPEHLSDLQWLYLDKANSLQKLIQALEEQSQKIGHDNQVSYKDINDKEVHDTSNITKESWEGVPGYDIEFYTPVFHSNRFENLSEITKIIEARFIRILHEYRSEKMEQFSGLFSWTENKYRRTNTFHASYNKIFYSHNFISILYTIDWYGAGAAHPNQYYYSYNFFLEPLTRVKETEYMFKSPAEALKIIRHYVRKGLFEMKSSLIKEYRGEEKLDIDSVRWIIKGTENWDELSVFCFTEKGLLFSFSPYQVGSYAEGAYFVEVPYKVFAKELKKDFVHALPITFYDELSN